MSRTRVISREYKLMLRVDRFVGNRVQLLDAASAFWQALQPVLEPYTFGVTGNLDSIEKHRAVRFYDTETNQLRQNDYVFRERIDLERNQREVTLKFRHPDRYIVVDRNMDAAERNRGKTKLEEDIKPPFLKLYSFSTKQDIDDDRSFDRLKDIDDLYPDFSKKLDNYKKKVSLHCLGNFTARELVVTGGFFKLRKSPERNAECALVAWYVNGGDAETPQVVEFSFRYGDEKEDYSGKMARRAYNVFQGIQSGLTNWIDPKSKTKTAYVYHLASQALPISS